MTEPVKSYNMMLKTDAARARNWGDWEIVREFVQNSLDEVGKANVYRERGDLVISDEGAGFDARSFLVGETTKLNPECNRGKFGNGMKYAALTCLLKGYKVRIHSRDYLYEALLVPTEFVVGRGKSEYIDSLVINQYEVEEIPGTEIRIEGYRGEHFRQNFIFYNKKDAFRVLYSEEKHPDSCPDKTFYNCIMKPGGSLFVKDIYVGELKDSLFSYNLYDVELTEERNLADPWTLDLAIGKVLMSCTDTNILSELLRAIYSGQPYEEKIEFVRYSTEQRFRDNIENWRKALSSTFPNYFDENGEPKFFYTLDKDVEHRVNYITKGKFDFLNLPGRFLKLLEQAGFIRHGLDIIQEYSKQLVKVVKESNLSEIEKLHLQIIRDLYVELLSEESRSSIANSAELQYEIHVDLEETPFCNILVMTYDTNDVCATLDREKNVIGIAKKRIDRLQLAIESMSHEFVHQIEPIDIERGDVKFSQLQIVVLMEIAKIISDRKIELPSEIVW